MGKIVAQKHVELIWIHQQTVIVASIWLYSLPSLHSWNIDKATGLLSGRWSNSNALPRIKKESPPLQRV